ncbi:hypothetical protein [Methylomonas sp. UP202]|uniref:hypothetical protein n=1 Tax=Methylomonas sp. UP202 TaxID=3040943 RepID=UPI0024789E59|nr:hypothetical protein [Methylomonas sp. UP202]WGS88136.1 hypothetical protein QC632_10340 [Methylomonas sp. UP202]
MNSTFSGTTPANQISTQKMTNNPTTITINLNSSDYNSDVPVDELVHRSSYEDLKKKIDNDLQKAHRSSKDCKDDIAFFDKYPSGSGLVYFIDGTRGAGKSTFLCSAFKGLSDIGRDGACPNLARLAYIDPSRLENNEIILLSVLKALKEAVDKHKPRQRNEESYKDFRENFKKLAGGLSLFAKDHHPLQHLDPELFLDHGLTRAGHSKDLRRHLHEVFDYACKLLGAEAMLLAFDDADTNAAHAHEVLECIRNYLDTPRIVTLVTGDLELYSLLVRDHFFNNLGHSRYDKDDERHQQRVRMEDHLEDQYLLKLFPIQRRYQLRPMGTLLKDSTIVYTLAHDDGFDKRTPQVALDELIRRGLRIKNTAVLALYREFLLLQPLRSVLQLLSRCVPHLSKKVSEDKMEKVWDEKLSEALRESLRAMALGSLYKFGVDVDALANKDLPALIDAVFELALLDGDSDTAAYLRPQTKDENLKCCFTALAAEVAGQCATNPSMAIQYLLGGPGSVSLFGKELRRNEKNIDRDTLRHQFRQYMGIGRREDALNWARHATAIIAATHRQNGTLIEFGVIGLNKTKPNNSATEENSKKFPNFDSFSNFFKNKNELPIFGLSLVDLSGSSSGTTYASIYNILGLIDRMLVADDVSEVLKKPYPALSISRPEWGSGWSGSVDDDVMLENDGTDGAGIGQSGVVDGNAESEEKKKMPMLSDDVIAEIVEWKEKFRIAFGKLTPSAVMLGKIWTRLYFSLEKASDTLRPGIKYRAASMMEIFALCVINAFLVEEVEHHLATDGSNAPPLNDRTNPQTSAKDFINYKIAFLAEHKDALPFTYAIATCPLIVGLIKPESYAVDNFSTLLFSNKGQTNKNKVKKLLCSEEHWELINKSFIAGRCTKPKSKKDGVPLAVDEWN